MQYVVCSRGRHPSCFRLLASCQQGFILLFASLIASVLLTIGIGISTIVLKELRLSSIGRESQIAFFAADTGIECALYWNEIGHGDVFKTSAGTGSFNCAGQSVLAGTNNPASSDHANMIIGGQALSHFGISPISVLDDSCVDVTVEKRDVGSTIIIAHGYNACVSDDRRVERALRVRVKPP